MTNEIMEDEAAREYGWMITQDHRAARGETGDKGRTGPQHVASHHLAMLAAESPVEDGYERHTFYMYGENDELYYTGRGVFRADGPLCLDALAAPLGQFGEVEGSAERIAWEGHPEWDVE